MCCYAPGAVDELLKLLISKMQHKARLLLPVMALFFSLGGAIFGMGEEAMAFAILLVPLVRMLGYDAITAVLLTYGATQIGFATSWMNPFSVAIAQSIAGLPPLSGSGFRIAMWLAFTLIYIAWFIWRAERLRRKADQQTDFQIDPSVSLGPFVGRFDLSGRHGVGGLGCGNSRLFSEGNCYAVFCHGYCQL